MWLEVPEGRYNKAHRLNRGLRVATIHSPEEAAHGGPVVPPLRGFSALLYVSGRGHV